MIRPVIVMFIQITRMFDRSFAILFAVTAISAQGQEPCLLFDGVDDQVTMPNAVLNNIGTGTFTVEAWVRGVESQQPTHPRILSNRDVMNNGFMFGLHGLWGGSAYKMLCMQLDGMNYILINNGSYNGSILDGSCHHVAVSKDTDSLRFYVDGAHIGSRVLLGNPSAATSAVNMLIGNDAPDPQPFNGNISQVRLWNVVRTQTQIAANMNHSIPGSTPGLVGYWELNDAGGQSIADATGNAPGVLGLTPATEAEDAAWQGNGCTMLGPASSGCLRFDGDAAQVTMPNAVLNNIGTGTFTVEAWVRGVESQQPTHPRILSNRDVMDNGFMFGVHGVWGGSAYKMLCMQLDGMNYILINNGSYNGSILDGSCHHLAVSKGVDSLRFYVDGAHIGSKVLQGDPSAATSAVNMLIGNDAPDPQPFNGNISQVRLWNEARTQAQIASAMHYSIPGTTPGLVGYWELNEGSGQTVIDKTTTTNGVLGLGSGTEGEDPVWTSDCCAIGIGNAVPDGPAIRGVLIHPVPVNDVLVIELPALNAATELIITDAAGRSVHSGRTDGRPSTMMDLSHLPAGAYVLHIRTRSNVYAEHFVKN